MKYVLCILLFVIPVELAFTFSVEPIKYVDTSLFIVKTDSWRLDSLLNAIDDVSIDSLKSLIAKKETNGVENPYHATNKYGMLGKYQFAPSTLKGLGYNASDIKNFLGNEIVQEEAMEKLLIANYKLIKKKGLTKYVGKKIGNVPITLSGILAGCHLVGPASVQHYLVNGGSMEQVVVARENQPPVVLRKIDGNGMTIKKYLSILN